MVTHKIDGDRTKSRRNWQVHVRAQEQSGLSRAEYCRQHDLSYHALTYWKRKLYRSCRQHTQLVPVPVKTRTFDKSASVSGIKILLNDRLTVEVAEHFSSKALSRVLSVLENR